MPVSIRPLHPVFAGEVAGIDCRKALCQAEVSAIEAGMGRYAVLVLRDQDLTDEEQIAFTRHFGELESYSTPGHIRRREGQRLGPGIADFSNLDKDGRIMSPEDRVWFFKLGDRLWHSDSSFRPIPAKYSILSGRLIPSWGANTEFADMRAAYDALDARSKAEIEDLVCEHSLIYSREAIGFTDLTSEETASALIPQRRLPDWLKRPIPAAGGTYFTKNLIAELGLETICESARCPNRSECWTRRTATFMILGEVCTRPCGFCAVKRGHPEPVAADEPDRLAEACARLGLRHVVIT